MGDKYAEDLAKMREKRRRMPWMEKKKLLDKCSEGCECEVKAPSGVKVGIGMVEVILFGGKGTASSRRRLIMM